MARLLRRWRIEQLALDLRWPVVTVAPWTRKHRSAAELWPRADMPVEWLLYPPSSGARLLWCILLDDIPVGRITLREVSVVSARLGMYLSGAYVGRGIGSDALVVFLRDVFPTLSITSLYVDCCVANRRAYNCFARAGFSMVRYMRRGGGILYCEMVYSVS